MTTVKQLKKELQQLEWSLEHAIGMRDGLDDMITEETERIDDLQTAAEDAAAKLSKPLEQYAYFWGRGGWAGNKEYKHPQAREAQGARARVESAQKTLEKYQTQKITAYWDKQAEELQGQVDTYRTLVTIHEANDLEMARIKAIKAANKKPAPLKVQAPSVAAIPYEVWASVLDKTLSQWSSQVGRTLVKIEDYNTGYETTVYLSTLKEYARLFIRDDSLLMLHVVKETPVRKPVRNYGPNGGTRFEGVLVENVLEIAYPGGRSNLLPQTVGDGLYRLEVG